MSRSAGRSETRRNEELLCARGTVTYDLLLRVVRVRLAILDELDGVLLKLVEVVGGVGRRVGLDTEKGEVLDNRLLELGLRRGGRRRVSGVCSGLRCLATVREGYSERVEEKTGRRKLGTHLLLRRVSVVETDEELAVVHPGEVLVEYCRLRLA